MDSDPQPPTKPARSGWSILCLVARECSGHRWQLVAVALLDAVTAPLRLMQPLALMVFFDYYLNAGQLPAAVEAYVPDALLSMDDRMGYLCIAVALIVVPALINQFIGFHSRILRTYVMERLVLNFRIRLFGHIEKLSLTYHDEEGPSESTFRVMMDTAVVPGILMAGLIPSLQSLVLLSVIAVVVLAKSWQLALVAIGGGFVLLLISWPFGKSLRRQWHSIKELQARVLATLQEVFSSVRVVKAFGKGKRESNRLFELAETSLHARVRVARTQSWLTLINSLLRAMAIIAFMIYGGLMVREGTLTIGELFLIAALMLQFFAPLQQLVGQITALQSNLASAERVLDLLDHAPEVTERPDARPMDRAHGDVAFRDVRFGYEEGKLALDGLSFEVERGTRVGIAGHTGAGKSTLMSLLTRLYDPESGAILLDGVDLRDIKIQDLRKQFAVVLQDPVLFKKSIAENIRYGAPDATDEQGIEAARSANAHDFISALPDGYDTIVGDRGQRMSGGERQRISLARAFLKDAPILILDEPTSSVDMRTEAAIMDALKRLMHGRTAFIIAHRPSTLESCDKVLVIEKGKVVTFASPQSVESLDQLMLATAEGSDNRRDRRDRRDERQHHDPGNPTARDGAHPRSEPNGKE